jgi:hypothetical protein
MAAVLGAFVPDTAVRWRGVVTGEVARWMGVAAEAKKLAARLDRVGAAVGDAEARAARGDEAAAPWRTRRAEPLTGAGSRRDGTRLRNSTSRQESITNTYI